MRYIAKVVVSFALVLTPSMAGGQDNPLLSPSKARDNFVSNSIQGCVANAGDSLKAFPWAFVSRFCECVGDRTADIISAEELLFETKNTGVSTEFAARLKRDVFPFCLAVATAATAPKP
jgi:hypothetical protein